MDDAVELEIRPRFPLFGGWKTHYVIGYNVPSYEYLFNKGEDFVLNMRLLDHIFDDMLVRIFIDKIKINTTLKADPEMMFLHLKKLPKSELYQNCEFTLLVH